MAPTRLTAALVLATVVTVPAVLSLAAAVAEPVRLENGLLSGTTGSHSEVRVYKGIPFAAPPVGELRWRAPRPAANWDGVRAGEAFSANCMQRSPDGGSFPPYGGDRSAMRMSEDCLYLNVYTASPSPRVKRPVMVWIHGGAFTSGAGGIYEGEELALKGVVVVTVNYRLGVFGFLAHPELTKEAEPHASGNYGFLDQIAALKWVQKNIAAFGGDPSRVTIFGESAGSWSVNCLMASPLARGLFHRVIGESGGQFAGPATPYSPGRPLADAERAGVAFAESAGAPTLAALRAVKAEDLARANGFQTGATVDGWFLPSDVASIFSNGRQNDVPIIIGSNADEGSIFTPATVTAQTFTEQSRRRFGPSAAAFLNLYPATTDEQARAAQAASMRDQTFGWEMRTWARLQARTGKSKVYLYYFSRVPPLPNASWLGAQHGAEIPYAFNWPNGERSDRVSWTDVDRKLAEQVSSYWVTFAATGDPNGKHLLKWPAYQVKDETAMGFADAPAMIAVPNKPALDFIDDYSRRRESSAAPTSSAR